MSDVDTIRVLLRAAGLPASDPEITAYAAGFPGLRAGVEMLYAAPEVRRVDPALRFRADAVNPVTGRAG